MKNILALLLSVAALVADAQSIYGRHLYVPVATTSGVYRLTWRDTNEQFIARYADSPETRGRDRQIAELDYLASKGCNMITVSLNNSDANFKVFTSINPITFNETLLSQLETYIRAANDRGIVVCLYLSEKENHKSWTDLDHGVFIAKVCQRFQKYCVVWSREEVSPDVAWVKKWYGVQQAADTLNPHFIHNNPGERPWIGIGREYLDGVAMQVKSNPVQDAASIVASCRANALASLKQEAYPISGTNIDTATFRQWFYAGGEPNAGFFKTNYDHSTPNPSAQEPFYTLLGSYPINATQPPQTTVKLFISTAVNHPANAAELVEGAVLTVGQYSVFTQVAGTFDLYKGGVRQAGFPITETQAPFDMWRTTGTNANLYTFTEGSWKLIFTPKIGTAGTVNFTVGAVTPPPADIKGTDFFLTPNGKIKFRFENGADKMVTPD